MQILLGANETIIKINSLSLKIDQIQSFIAQHFSQKQIKSNSIFIPAHNQDCHKRVFLLKWCYSIYSKKTNILLPQLKEQLVKRHKKSIRIILTTKIHTKQEKKSRKQEHKKVVINRIDLPLQRAYKLLGSSPLEDVKRLKKRYKKLAMEFHPDRVCNADTEIIKQHTIKFQQILEAYRLLLPHAA